MSKRTEQIPIPGELDEVIDESLEILKNEKRKQRVRVFAGIAAGLFLCIGGFRAAVGSLQPPGGDGNRAEGTKQAEGTRQTEGTKQAEGADRAGQGTLAALPQDAETDRLLVKEQPAEGSCTRKENFVYMQESEGVSVMVSNVYHNGYTLYMTVTLRGEEPFADSLGCELPLGGEASRELCRIGIVSEGTAELPQMEDKESGAGMDGADESAGDEDGGACEADSAGLDVPEYIEGYFLDDRTFLGTVRAALSAEDQSDGGKIEEDFYYNWSLSSFGTGGEGGARYEGNWEFRAAVPADMSNKEVKEINRTNESGEGIEYIVKAAEDVSARALLPAGAQENDYAVVMCDASGALLNRAGDYFRTENRDISTVYVFLCGREALGRLEDEYESVDRKNGASAWIQSLRECARYSTEVHFDSEYLSVVQAAWGGRK